MRSGHRDGRRSGGRRAIAAPLVATELWFDTRSRSRRLVPELAGTYGICSVAAMILLAAGSPAGRSGRRLADPRRPGHHRDPPRPRPDRPPPPPDLVFAGADLLVADVAALAVAIARAVRPPIRRSPPDAVAVVGVVAFQRLTARTPVPAKVIGIRQSLLGLAVVAATAVGIHLT
jgi:hypothetical protein